MLLSTTERADATVGVSLAQDFAPICNRPARGRVIITRNSAGQTIRRSVSFIKNPPISTMSHELGHAIDYHLRDKANSFWESKVYRDNTATIQTEFENVGKDKYNEALERQPSLVDGSFFRDYVFTRQEGYANAFELFLTDYKKAMRVVPNRGPLRIGAK